MTIARAFGPTFIRDAQVFDGSHEAPNRDTRFPTEGNVSKAAPNGVNHAPGADVIAAGGRVRKPGFVAARGRLVGPMPIGEQRHHRHKERRTRRDACGAHVPYERTHRGARRNRQRVLRGEGPRARMRGRTAELLRPAREVVGVCSSTGPVNLDADILMGYLRNAAKNIIGKWKSELLKTQVLLVRIMASKSGDGK